jgi:hypothetical protein
MASPLFAAQFDVAPPYQPAGLDTEDLATGLTLPSTKTPRTPEENPTEKTPQTNNVNARATAQAQAQASALAHAESMAPVQVSAPVHATVAGAQAAANASSANGFGHWVAHTFDSARHGVASAADATNNVMTSPTVHSIMNIGNPFPAGSPGNPSTPLFQTQQAISDVVPKQSMNIVGRIRLNPNSPVYDEPAPYQAMPRGWSANAVGPGTPRSAIEAPQTALNDPLQSLIHEPSYSAMPRGWSANMNPIQFNSEGSPSALPKGVQANGGWLSDAESILSDIADSL